MSELDNILKRIEREMNEAYDDNERDKIKLAQKYNIPTIGIAGMLGQGYTLVHQDGLEAVRSIVTGPMSLKDASKSAYKLITESVEQSLRFINVGMKLK